MQSFVDPSFFRCHNSSFVDISAVLEPSKLAYIVETMGIFFSVGDCARTQAPPPLSVTLFKARSTFFELPIFWSLLKGDFFFPASPFLSPPPPFFFYFSSPRRVCFL